MFAPHHAENAELRDVRVAAEDLLNARVLLARHAVFGGDLRSYFDFGACGGHRLFGCVPCAWCLAGLFRPVLPVMLKSSGPFGFAEAGRIFIRQRLAKLKRALKTQKRAELAENRQTTRGIVRGPADVDLVGMDFGVDAVIDVS